MGLPVVATRVLDDTASEAEELRHIGMVSDYPGVIPSNERDRRGGHHRDGGRWK